MNKCISFALGTIVGAVAGIFIAPKLGDEPLEAIKETASDLSQRGIKCCEDTVEKIQSSASNIRAAGSAESDSLQGKIDAARQIIAEQIAKNAKDAKEAIKGSSTIAVEAIEVTKDDIDSKADEIEEAIEEKVENAVDKVKQATMKAKEALQEKLGDSDSEQESIAAPIEADDELKAQIKSAINDKF